MALGTNYARIPTLKQSQKIFAAINLSFRKRNPFCQDCDRGDECKLNPTRDCERAKEFYGASS